MDPFRSTKPIFDGLVSAARVCGNTKTCVNIYIAPMTVEPKSRWS